MKGIAALPAQWGWIGQEPGPAMLYAALQYYGVKEAPGPQDNAIILQWAKLLGGDVAKLYRHDSIPWCGLFIAHVAKSAGETPPPSPLWARAWAAFGRKSGKAGLGDVLVFVRQGGGHVGLYVGEDASRYYVLGGNQGDAVSIVPIDKSRCIAVRRALNPGPAKIRPVFVSRKGASSRNEA